MTRTEERTGIFTMSAEEYHADPAPEPSLSASIAHILCSQSPLHAWTAHPRLNPAAVEEEKEHFDIGTIAHALILEGESVATVLDFPDWRTKAAREARDAARANGKVPILTKHWTAVQEMVSAAQLQLGRHTDAKDAFTNGKPEQTLTWQEDGIWCRARTDWLHNSYLKIDDLKTTGISANPEIVSRTLFNNGLDIQAAFYLRGVKAITGKDAQFRFVFVETAPPYALSVVSLGPDVLMLAEKKVLYALVVWKACLTENRWPGYPARTCYASLSEWEEAKWLQRETAGAY